MQETESTMQKAIEAVKKHFSGVRTGRANPSLIDSLQIEYYGAFMPLKQIATISVPEPRQLLITPFDRSATAAIEKAIMTSDLGLNPQGGTDTIRINLPQLTEERRKELIKVIRQFAEEGKVSLRNARHATLDQIKKQEKEKVLTEDEAKLRQEALQKITDKYMLQVDELLKKKEIEVMEI